MSDLGRIPARLGDWLFGRRDWCVIDDGMTGHADDIYACPRSRVDEHDVVAVDCLRRAEARDIAGMMRNGRYCTDPIRIAQGWTPKARTTPPAPSQPGTAASEERHDV